MSQGDLRILKMKTHHKLWVIMGFKD